MIVSAADGSEVAILGCRDNGAWKERKYPSKPDCEMRRKDGNR